MEGIWMSDGSWEPDSIGPIGGGENEKKRGMPLFGFDRIGVSTCSIVVQERTSC